MLECVKCNTKIDLKISDLVYCCEGSLCGCMGLPIDPPLCDKCEEELFENDK